MFLNLELNRMLSLENGVVLGDTILILMILLTGVSKICTYSQLFPYYRNCYCNNKHFHFLNIIILTGYYKICC